MAWGSNGSLRSCDAILKRVEANDPALTELVILPMKTFGPSDVDRLSIAIASGINTNLQSISASGHDLPRESLKRLGLALSTQAKLLSSQGSNGGILGITSIAIGSNNMSDVGVIAFCQGLDESNGGLLRVVDFGWKNFGKDGLYAIGKTFWVSKYLTQIDLSRNNNIGNEGIICLVVAATEHASSDAVVFPSLEILNLSDCNIGPLGMQTLAKMLLRDNRCKRIDIELCANPIGSEGCQTLSKLIAIPGRGSIISRLNLSQCAVGDEGVTLLSNAATSNSCLGLTFLDLSENSITCDGARILARSLTDSWPSLIELKLAKNNLGNDGVTLLMNSIHTNNTLQHLDLICTGCGKEGAIAALNNSGCLTTLRLFNNRLGSDGFHAISSCLRGGHASIENLDLGGNNADEDSVIELLNNIADNGDSDVKSKLSVLEIGGNTFGAKAMEALTKLKQVFPHLDVAHDKPIDTAEEELSD